MKKFFKKIAEWFKKLFSPKKDKRTTGSSASINQENNDRVHEKQLRDEHD